MVREHLRGTRSMAPPHEIDLAGLAARIEALPGFAAVRRAAREAAVPGYLVGGAVRDALLGAGRADLDVVVEGDPVAVARALGDEVREHPRFLTATSFTEHGPVDVARARSETYAEPGALPTVRPATLAEDLGRRDFSVNAIAVALERPGEPIDPHDGIGDLAAGTLRLLHGRSIRDDPTRALRAARYAARIGLEPDAASLAQIHAADLESVSADRVEAEIARIAAEREPVVALALLDRWSLLELGAQRLELVERLTPLLGTDPWQEAVAHDRAIVAAVSADLAGATELAAADPPERPSEAVERARGRPMDELVMARALGAAWLDDYVATWRHTRLAVSGEDLLAAGIPRGPAIGAGLAAALRARLDGEAPDRETQLRIALATARERDDGEAPDPL